MPNVKFIKGCKNDTRFGHKALGDGSARTNYEYVKERYVGGV